MSFASDLAKKSKEEQQADKAKDDAFLERRNLIKAKAPGYWESMRSWFQTTLEEFNTEIGANQVVMQVSPSSEVNLRFTPEGRKPREIRIRFDQAASEVKVAVPGERDARILSFVFGNDHLSLTGLGNGRSLTLEQNCEEIFRLLID